MDPAALLATYRAGPGQLREAIRGLTPTQLDATPVAGKWSTRQVVCHIADFEPVYLDRIKRVIAEEEPTFFSGDPDLFAARLEYPARDLEGELLLIEACRRHLASILAAVPASTWARQGRHSEAGLMTVEKLLSNIAQHIPHHLPFIAEKRRALGC